MATRIIGVVCWENKRMRKSGESFEQFYMNKVALGEGCGCAEMIVPVHDQNRRADGIRSQIGVGISLASAFRAIAARLRPGRK